MDVSSIKEKMAAIDSQAEQQKRALVEPAKKRIEEIRQSRTALDREEEELLALIGEPRRGGVGRKPRTGKRMTALHKKEIIGRFIENGHIRPNTDLSRELRIALTDEGFGSNDFRKLTAYMPAGWEARSNGQRGTAARTVFLKG